MKASARLSKFKGAAKKVIAVNKVRRARPTIVERHGGLWGFLSFVLFLLWSLPSAIYRHRRWLRQNPGAAAAGVATPAPRRALLQAPVTVDVATVTELRAAMADATVAAVRLTNDIALDDDNGELPAVTRRVTVSGEACAATSPPGCAIDARSTSRHVTVGATGALTLRQMALVNGAPPLSAQPFSDGGAAFVFGELHAVDVAFRSNEATADGDASSGGAVKVQGGAFACERCEFVGNVAAKNGGAVAIDRVSANLVDSSFSANKAGALGAGVAGDHATIIVRDCAFAADNVAREDDSRDVYVGAFGSARIWPFAISGGADGVAGYAAAGLGVVEPAPFESPPPGSVSPPPPPSQGVNGTVTSGVGDDEVAGSNPPSGATDVSAAVSGVGVEGVLGGVCAFALFVCIGAWVHGRERRRYRATERDVAAQHAKMERAIARREEELARGERAAVANRAKRAARVSADDDDAGGGGGGRRGTAVRGAFEPRRAGGDDEEPERDGMEDDADDAPVPDGVYDAPAAPRDSAWSLAAAAERSGNVGSRVGGGRGFESVVAPLEFGARGWDAGKTGGFTRPQWAGAAAAARRAAEGARGGLYAGGGGGGGGGTRETMNAPSLGPSGAVPVAVTPRDGSRERPPAVASHRHAATTTALRDRVAPGAVITAAPRFGAPAGRSGDGVSGGGAVEST